MDLIASAHRNAIDHLRGVADQPRGEIESLAGIRRTLLAEPVSITPSLHALRCLMSASGMEALELRRASPLRSRVTAISKPAICLPFGVEEEDVGLADLDADHVDAPRRCEPRHWRTVGSATSTSLMSAWKVDNRNRLADAERHEARSSPSLAADGGSPASGDLRSAVRCAICDRRQRRAGDGHGNECAQQIGSGGADLLIRLTSPMSLTSFTIAHLGVVTVPTPIAYRSFDAALLAVCLPTGGSSVVSDWRRCMLRKASDSEPVLAATKRQRFRPGVRRQFERRGLADHDLLAVFLARRSGRSRERGRW